MKPKRACGIVGKKIASQNDLLVTEHELREREQVIAYYVREVERLRELLEKSRLDALKSG
jgi:hypothetical protein